MVGATIILNKELVKLGIFLATAKKSTYASQGEANEIILADGGKEFSDVANGFTYRDRYYGFNPLSGQEIVFKNKVAIWSMNYYGKIIDSSSSPKEVYAFLKEALRQVEKELPYRGPARFNKDKFEYRNESKGGLENFIGEEIIRYNGKEVYTLYYHGGLIK